MKILPKLIRKFNAICLNLSFFFFLNWQTNPNIHMSMQEIQNSLNDLKK